MKFDIDPNSAIPLYKQIEDIIRKVIESGDYDNGKFLPREEELAQKFGVSRNTVRQGISQLVREGLLERTPGKGTVVANGNITTHLSEWHSFTEEMLKKGIDLRNYFIRSNFEKPPIEVAEVLQIKPDIELLKLERLRGDKKHPFVYFVSWFHPRIKLTGNEDFSRPLYSILEDDFGIYPVYSNEELSAVMPDERISGYLKINLKSRLPVLFRKRLVTDSGLRSIEYNLGFYRSDLMTYSIRFKRTSE